MANKFIFSSSSYLVVMNFDEDSLKTAEAIAAENGFRLYHAESIEELTRCVDKIQHPINYLINAQALSPTDLNTVIALLKCAKTSYRLLENPTADVLSEAIRASMDSFLPAGSEDFLPKVINYILPLVFQGAGELPFTVTNETDGACDFVVLCSSGSEDWKAQCYIYCDLEKLKAHFPYFANREFPMLLDGFCELSNQFFGILNFNINQLGVTTKIGLPVSFDLRNGGTKPKSAIFTRYLQLSAAKGAIRVDFGIIPSNNGYPPDFTKIQFATPSDEVDFF